MLVTILPSVTAVGATAWRPFEAPSFPFADFEFLAALEASGSVGAGTGWQPALVAVGEDGAAPDGIALTYAKSHSYGEYVFDWEWARLYQRHGAAYYPKLVAAVPFTPATGPRLLVRAGADTHAVQAALVGAVTALGDDADVSSCHALFVPAAEAAAFAAAGYAVRHSCQYHWRNPGYRDFADFLDALVGKRRRDVMRERRHAQAHGLRIERVTGAGLTPALAAAMEELYLATADKKSAIPYLKPGLFARLFEAMPDRILLVTATAAGGGVVAAALNFYKDTALFGRYWGARAEHADLHFELCYYQTIEFAIERRLTLFEAGAQGEHKIQRGFLPALTLSAHWLRAPAFRRAITAYIAEEQASVAAEMAALAAKGPFKGE